jgi:hypothetical protein
MNMDWNLGGETVIELALAVLVLIILRGRG